MPKHYDAYYVYNICKKTCGKCDPTYPPTYVPTLSTTYVPTYAPTFLPTSSPTQSPTECEDDDTCYAVAHGHKILTLCVWAGSEISRCQLESKDYVTPESMPKHYDAYYVYNICKKTCGKCGTNVDPKPATVRTACKDDNTCVAKTRGNNIVLSLCEWTSKNLQRCRLKSQKFITPESMPSYHAPLISDICKETCGIC